MNYKALRRLNCRSFFLLLNLLSHHEDVMEVLLILILVCNYSRSGDSWLSNFMSEDSPVELWLLEVSHSLFREAIGDADVYTSG